MGVNKVEYGSSTLVDLTGDTVTPETLLQGETAHNAAGNRITGTARPGVQSFNGRNGSVLPIAGDYSADQVNYDSNKTVKQVIDALATKEASDITGQQSLLKDTVGWTGKNLADNSKTKSMASANLSVFSLNDNGGFSISGSAQYLASRTPLSNLVVGEQYIASIKVVSSTNSDARLTTRNSKNQIQNTKLFGTTPGVYELPFTYQNGWYLSVICNFETTPQSSMEIEEIMVRKADITDPTYEPYHESVEVMYEEEIHGVNLLKNKTGTLSYQGVTFTTDSNGYITANGLATNFAYWNIEDCLDFSELRVGDEYILSGCPQGGSNSTYCMYIQTSANSYLMEYGQGLKFKYTGTNIVNIAVQIRKDYNANNVVFKPMLRKADIEDSTYRPYNPQAIQNQLNAQGVLGAKNLLKNIATSQTINGVTVTVDDDKVITLNGTSTADSYINIFTTSDLNGVLAKYGDLILNGSHPTEYTKARMITRYGTSNYVVDLGKGVLLSSAITYEIAITLQIFKDNTFTNHKVYPMLRLASDPDDTYVPYAMTNKELTEKVSHKVLLEWSNHYAVADEMILSDSINNYYRLTFVLGRNNDNDGLQYSDIIIHSQGFGINNNYICILFFDLNATHRLTLQRVSSTKIKIITSDLTESNYGIRMIVGDK